MTQVVAQLHENKVEELRTKMREVVSSVKDPSGSMLDVLLMSQQVNHLNSTALHPGSNLGLLGFTTSVIGGDYGLDISGHSS